ncbi:MAG: SUMF1/EgtB/PvdO family nonheme iron enzyme [Candidatus Poribacteria bacterium]|nr:SUMF1/EgtB/PvdO family nonheme iron enzyme [Candidatus Poribacteria bacterium]
MRKKFSVCLILICLIGCFDSIDTDIIQQVEKIDTGMVLIPAGEVTIGLSQKQFERHKQQYPPAIPVTIEWYTVQRKTYLPAALPLQTVYVDAFYMDTHEVTWGQYLDFMDASGYESKSVTTRIHDWGWGIDSIDRELPISQLTIADMKAYAEWHNKEIPTEIEWEKAARGGLTDMNYPWGNTIEPTHANYNHAGFLNAFSAEDGTRVLSPVAGGQYPPNGYGLFDMSGNVSEYVTTEWDSSSEIEISVVIARGGNYRHSGFYQQNWYRKRRVTGPGHNFVGFRCIKRINSPVP